MWWECSECGSHAQGARPPLVCSECGLAGIIFVPVEIEEPIAGDPDVDSLRSAWLRAGMERGEVALES